MKQHLSAVTADIGLHPYEGYIIAFSDDAIDLAVRVEVAAAERTAFRLTHGFTLARESGGRASGKTALLLV